MSRNSVCRTCLAVNSRMYDLKATYLQDLFEKLTSIKLITEDGKSRVCYICYSQLQKCQRFILMSQKADKIFRLVLDKGIEIPKSSRPLNNFTVTPVDCLTLPDRAPETLVTVKIEPADVKEEVIDVDENGLFDEIKIEGVFKEDIFKEDLMKVCDEENVIIVEESDTETYKEELNLIVQNYPDSKKTTYRCKECNKDFNRFHSLKSHMIIHNNNDISEYACNICDETFTSKSIFQNHMRKHTKPHTCNICDKTFSELSTLKKHTASHSSDKHFICGTCKKGFTHKAFLVTHLRTHTGVKPFSCDICAKSFGQVGHLISHKRTHSKIKPFPCSQCDKAFSERSTLKRHKMRLHNSLKPFACKICYWTFSEKEALEKHQKNHLVRRNHIGYKPVCKHCGKGFSTVGNMRKHMKIHDRESSICMSQT